MSTELVCKIYGTCQIKYIESNFYGKICDAIDTNENNENPHFNDKMFHNYAKIPVSCWEMKYEENPSDFIGINRMDWALFIFYEWAGQFSIEL